MPPARVVAVAPGSPAAAAGVTAGDLLLAVNGVEPRDVIEYRWEADDGLVELELSSGGSERRVVVEKTPGAPLGLELDRALFDRVRTCDNRCSFCFVYQLPPGLRRSLSVKDDDYRLSFLYGNFTTLTRFTEADLERVVGQGLSPLHVSIHTTDPALRARMLNNRRGATSLRWLGRLLDAGGVVPGEVVVCPGLNDGAALEDTLRGVLEEYPRLASVGLVPVGVSAHQRDPGLRPHTPGEAAAVIDAVERWQARYRSRLGRRLAHAADELYLRAGRPFPPLEHYEGCSQHENGIGMARTFEAEVRAALTAHPPGVSPRAAPSSSEIGHLCTPGMHERPNRREERGEVGERGVAIVTGELGAAVLAPLLDDLAGCSAAPVRLVVVPNRFFGGNVAVTGLLTGADLSAVLATEPADDRYLVPDVVLSEGRFLDDAVPDGLPRRVEVVPTDGAALVAALRGGGPGADHAAVRYGSDRMFPVSDPSCAGRR